MSELIQSQHEITNQHLATAVAMLSDIPFFPSDDDRRLMISEDLRRFCRNTIELWWLVRQARERMTRWEGACALKSIIESAREAKSDRERERQLDETTRRIDEWRREWQQENKGEQPMFLDSARHMNGIAPLRNLEAPRDDRAIESAKAQPPAPMKSPHPGTGLRTKAARQAQIAELEKQLNASGGGNAEVAQDC